jgi:Bacterial Ig-like domain
MEGTMVSRAFLIVATAVLGGACGSTHDMGSMMVTGPRTGTELLSVSPSGGATEVSMAPSLSITFSHAMLQGMEQYVDLHEGDLDGPLVPIRCSWSSDRITLGCTPDAPLKPRTRYSLHVGGGMMDADDHPVDLGLMGSQMGGQWAMGTSHHGPMMGNGWRGSNGSYGMSFSFTTA